MRPRRLIAIGVPLSLCACGSDGGLAVEVHDADRRAGVAEVHVTSGDEVLFEGRVETPWAMSLEVDEVHLEAVAEAERDDANFVCLVRDDDGFVSDSTSTGTCRVSYP